MATAPCPTLPTEVWLKVLQNWHKEEDLPELWTSLRYVCTTLKEAVEAIMREDHLRKTSILFQFDEVGDDFVHDEDNSPSGLEFEFSHLSEDTTKATFTPVDLAEKHKPEILGRLREAVENRTIQHPTYDVAIHREINDTPIPGLSVDYEAVQLTFDWREVFSIFYGEEHIYHRFLRDWTRKQKDWSIGLRQKMERGELDMEKMLEQVIGGFAVASEDARKHARRVRMRREYQRFRGIKWDPKTKVNNVQEKKALKRLQDARVVMGFSTSSDDAEDEEDEWEDEDESDAESHTKGE